MSRIDHTKFMQNQIIQAYIPTYKQIHTNIKTQMKIIPTYKQSHSDTNSTNKSYIYQSIFHTRVAAYALTTILSITYS